MPPDVLVVSCHYGEDVSWLARLPYPHVVYSKTDPAADRYLPRNVGVEAEAFLTFIVEQYDRLPRTAVFVHGHETSDHQDGTVAHLLASLGDLGQYAYRNFNSKMAMFVYDRRAMLRDRVMDEYFSLLDDAFVAAPQPILDSPHPWQNAELHRLVLGDDDPLPPYLVTMPCAQFVVHRDVIRSRPREYWRRLLDTMYALHDEHGLSGRDAGIVFEYLWFYIFTRETDEISFLRGRRHIRKRLDDMPADQPPKP